MRLSRHLGLVVPFAAVLLQTGPVAAEGGQLLVPPPAIAAAPERSTAGDGVAAPGSAPLTRAGSGLSALLAARLGLSQAHGADTNRRLPAFAAPIVSDPLVGVDLNGRRWHGWNASLSVNAETPRPVGSVGTLFGLKFEHRF